MQLPSILQGELLPRLLQGAFARFLAAAFSALVSSPIVALDLQAQALSPGDHAQMSSNDPSFSRYLFQAVSALNSLCLDAKGGTLDNSVQFITWDCKSGDANTINQTLRFWGVPTLPFGVTGWGPVKLGNTNDWCLAASGALQARTPIIVWQCVPHETQTWHYDVTKRQIQAQNGMCIDVNGGAPGRGTGLILWPCHDGLNQKWDMVVQRLPQ